VKQSIQQIQQLVEKTSRKQKPKPKQRESAFPANLSEFTITTQQEYDTILADQPNKLTVVRFYAPWCMSCHRSAPLWDRMVKTNPNISFVQLPVTEHNKGLFPDLGVSRLPWGNIVNRGELEEGLSMKPKLFRDFASTVAEIDAATKILAP
jgi:thiol-disulfide isomerase/thioredoxin